MPKRRQRVGVEPFVDDVDDDEDSDLISDDENISDEELERLMAKDTAKNKARRAAAEAEEPDEDEVEDDEAEDEDEDTEDEDESEDEDSDDDDDDEDEDEEETSGFTPWIYTDEAEWELTDAFKNVDRGDNVIIYDAANDRWYKMMPIRVGEIPPEPTDTPA